MPTITLSPSAKFATSASAANKSYYYLSSGDTFSSVDAPRARCITWTYTRPADVPWAACKITAADVDGVVTRNTGSSVKDASWSFRTQYNPTSWNGQRAQINGTTVWRYKGVCNGSWVGADSGTVTRNDITMTSLALQWIEQEFKGGRDIYFNVVEVRSAGGSMDSPSYGATRQTRVNYNNPTMTITYEITSNTRYYDGSVWNVVIPKYYDGSSWKQCIAKYWDGSAWVQV